LTSSRGRSLVSAGPWFFWLLLLSLGFIACSCSC
jgi:hypothetical protein